MIKVFKYYGDKNFNDLFNVLLEEKISKIKTDINMEKNTRYNRDNYLSTKKIEEVDKDE